MPFTGNAFKGGFVFCHTAEFLRLFDTAGVVSGMNLFSCFISCKAGFGDRDGRIFTYR